MKVYDDSKGSYILIRNKQVLEAAGFKPGMSYNIVVDDGSIKLELPVFSLEEA